MAYLAEPRARANSAGAAQRPAPPSPTGAGAGASRPSALIVQNPSQTPLSLIRLGISLIRRFNSLLGLKKFPVLSHRELTHKGLIRRAFCRWIWAT